MDFQEGEEVSLEISAEEGYEYTGLKIISEEHDFTKELNAADDPVFEMPAFDVKIMVSFEKLTEQTDGAQTEETAVDEEIIAELPEENSAEETFSLQEVKLASTSNNALLSSVGDVFDFWSDPNWGEGDVLYYGNINGTTTPAYCIDHSADRQTVILLYADQSGLLCESAGLCHETRISE